MGSTTKIGKSEMGQILGGRTEMKKWDKFSWTEGVIILGWNGVN